MAEDDPGPENAGAMADTTSENASFTLPLFACPSTNAPLTFRLMVTTDAGSKSRSVTSASSARAP